MEQTTSVEGSFPVPAQTLTFANQNELPWPTARLPFVQKFRTNFGFNPKPEIFIIFCFRTFFLLRNEFITLQLTGSSFLPFVFI